MPRSGSGVYSLPPSYLAVPGTTVRAEQHNTPLEDLAQAMTDSLPRNGAAPMIGPLNMNGRKITGLAAGTAAGDAVRFDQLTSLGGYLSSVNSLTFVADRISYATGPETAALAALTEFGRSIIDDADAAAGRTTLGFTVSDTARTVFNATVAHNDAAWTAGTLATPGMPTPAQVRLGAAGYALGGDGQEWRVLTSFRALNTTYTNSTTRPIKFNAEVLTSDGLVEVLVGAITVASHQYPGLNRYTVSEIVPPGQTYRINGSVTLEKWVELR